MSKISIIIPVYNVAPYVERCMDSIVHQTLQDLEVIFVDDHCKDDSIAIVQRYIQAHRLSKTWHIIATPTNSGPGIARNMGIEQASGQYIAFCDADDWVEPTMYEQLYDLAQNQNADISSSAAILDYPDGSHRLMLNPEVGSGEVSLEQRRYVLSHFVSNFTTMLFRREWLNQYSIRFPQARSGEDSSFMGQCYLVAQRIAQTNQPLYHYVIHEDSISHRTHVWRGKDKRKAFGALIDFAKLNGLWSTFRKELIFIYIKKALLTTIKEWIY